MAASRLFSSDVDPSSSVEELSDTDSGDTGLLGDAQKSRNVRGYEKEFFDRFYYLGKMKTGKLELGEFMEQINSESVYDVASGKSAEDLLREQQQRGDIRFNVEVYSSLHALPDHSHSSPRTNDTRRMGSLSSLMW